MPTEAAAAEAAADAAENVIFSRIDPDQVEDLDVTVRFRDGRLTVDIFLETGVDQTTERAVADDAAQAAGAAVDALFSDES